MNKKETIKECLAILRTENQQQTKAIDNLVQTINEHIKTSDVFRQEIIKHRTEISWLKKANLGIYSAIAIIIATIISTIFIH